MCVCVCVCVCECVCVCMYMWRCECYSTLSVHMHDHARVSINWELLVTQHSVWCGNKASSYNALDLLQFCAWGGGGGRYE